MKFAVLRKSLSRGSGRSCSSNNVWRLLPLHCINRQKNKNRIANMSIGLSEVQGWFNEPEIQVIGMAPVAVEKWAGEIDKCYCEPWRHYHTLHHLADMMKHLKTWKDRIVNSAAVLLAILFHDIVYIPKSSTNEDDSVVLFTKFAGDVGLSSTNEDDSVVLFTKFAGDVGLDDEIFQTVKQMITATIQHLPDDAPSANYDLKFFLDFDMAILGQAQAVYDLYAENIKKEYCHMSSEAFCRGRIKVLQTFLARPTVYFTEELRDAFEDQARSNMQNEIENLQRELQRMS